MNMGNFPICCIVYGGRSSVGRAPGCDPGCRGFESHRSPQIINKKLSLKLIFLRKLYKTELEFNNSNLFAKVAELVDALDLGSSGVTRESSSLSFRTISYVHKV